MRGTAAGSAAIDCCICICICIVSTDAGIGGMVDAVGMPRGLKCGGGGNGGGEISIVVPPRSVRCGMNSMSTLQKVIQPARSGGSLA